MQIFPIRVRGQSNSDQPCEVLSWSVIAASHRNRASHRFLGAHFRVLCSTCTDERYQKSDIPRENRPIGLMIYKRDDKVLVVETNRFESGTFSLNLCQTVRRLCTSLL